MTLVEHVRSTNDEWLKGFMAASYLYNNQLEQYQELRDEYVEKKGLNSETGGDRSSPG